MFHMTMMPMMSVVAPTPRNIGSSGSSRTSPKYRGLTTIIIPMTKNGSADRTSAESRPSADTALIFRCMWKRARMTFEVTRYKLAVAEHTERPVAGLTVGLGGSRSRHCTPFKEPGATSQRRCPGTLMFSENFTISAGSANA